MEPTERVTLTNMCMITDKNGNVLVEEKIGNGCKGIIFPGGHVEHNEPLVDAMIREIREETGLTVSGLRLCGVKDFIRENGERYLVFLYKTDCFTGELCSSAEGRVFWVPLSDLPSMRPMWYLSEMLEIFCGEQYSELYFTLCENQPEKPVLK